MTSEANNITLLRHEFEWLSECIQKRVNEYLNPRDEFFLNDLPAPALVFTDTPYAKLVQDHKLQDAERLALILAIASSMRPQILEKLIFKNQDNRPSSAPCISFSKNSGCVLPTGFTALFLCAGENEYKRIEYSKIFDADHLFSQKNILLLEEIPPAEPVYAGILTISSEWLDLLTLGKHRKPVFSSEFPAREINSPLDWEDLVLSSHTQSRIKNLVNRINFGDQLTQGNDLKNLAVFHGSPGTGKTATAGLIGKLCGKPVFKVDPSKILSKYIGETEKNLGRVFDRAQDKGWILFFDEADTFFSKRIENPQSSNDKFLNNETNFILQRLDSYKDIVILSTNLPNALESALGRRQYIKVDFLLPDVSQKIMLWQKKLNKNFSYAEDVVLEDFSLHPYLSAAHIQNIVNFAMIEAMSVDSTIITRELLSAGIQLESDKAGVILYNPARLFATPEPVLPGASQQMITPPFSTKEIETGEIPAPKIFPAEGFNQMHQDALDNEKRKLQIRKNHIALLKKI